MKWYHVLLILLFVIPAVFVLGMSFQNIDTNNDKYSECDNMYEDGSCQLYQCKMNYSNSIERSNAMYLLYHNCMIIESQCVNLKGEVK